jgi:hypothetical protein
MILDGGVDVSFVGYQFQRRDVSKISWFDRVSDVLLHAPSSSCVVVPVLHVD